jgi:hypothetical protein
MRMWASLTNFGPALSVGFDDVIRLHQREIVGWRLGGEFHANVAA